MLFIFILILVPAPAFAGSCQDVGGTVKCTDDIGHNPTLESLDKSLSRPGPMMPPPSYPDALKSYPSDLKSLYQGREGGRSRTTIEQKEEKHSLEGPSPKGRGR